MDVYEYRQVEWARGGHGKEKLHDILLNGGGWQVYATHIIGLHARDYTVVYVIRRAVN